MNGISKDDATLRGNFNGNFTHVQISLSADFLRLQRVALVLLQLLRGGYHYPLHPPMVDGCEHIASGDRGPTRLSLRHKEEWASSRCWYCEL